MKELGLNKLSIKDLPVSGRRVLMRVDFNVPLDDKGQISDDTRIRASLPSIQYLLNHDAALVLMSHLGRPKDKKVPGLSLKPCAERLSELLKRPVTIAPDCIGPEVNALVSQLKPGELILLENLRFHRAEEHPEEDSSFAKELASLADCYVNDAFGTAHRAHSSTVKVPEYFPEQAAAGFLMEKEIQFLGQMLASPKKPFVAIIGGAKISSKLGVLKALLRKVDTLLIGGAMAYTFLKAQGISIGNSLHEEELLPQAKDILEESRRLNIKLVLPLDHVVATHLAENATTKVVNNSLGIPEGFQGVDIGPKTIQLYAEALKEAKTVFWNGPLGIFEIKKFAAGTNAIAKILSELSAVTVVGGGDSIAALEAAHLTDKISHISTGGGASLEFIEYNTLPGINVLSSK
jgi:phosphoglycerate kinase